MRIGFEEVRREPIGLTQLYATNRVQNAGKPSGFGIVIGMDSGEGFLAGGLAIPIDFFGVTGEVKLLGKVEFSRG